MSTSSVDSDQEGDNLIISALVTENNNLKLQLQELVAEAQKFKKLLNSKDQILKKKYEFYKSEKYCDTILMTKDGKKFPIHKVILASQNEKFLELFDNSNNVTEIMIAYNSKTLQSILSYMYNESEIVVNGSNLEDLLNVAFFFNIDYIKSICLNFIESNSFEEEGLWNFWLKHEHDTIFNDWICSSIGNKFCDLTESTQTNFFTKLIGQNLINIINHEDFACPDEDDVYDFIVRWIKFDKSNRKMYLRDLMNLVKIPFLSKEYLYKMLNEPLLNDYMVEMNIRMKEIVVAHLSIDVDEYKKYKHNVNFKRRLPKSLGNPNVIIAASTIENKTVEQLHFKNGEPWEWTKGNTMFTPRYQWSEIVVFGQSVLYAIGGETEDHKPTNKVYYLDLSFFWQKWILTTPMKYARSLFDVCIDRENIYAIGGIGNNLKALKTMEVFNVQSGLWTVVKMNVARYLHSAVFYNGCIYVVGGEDENDKLIGSIQRYDTNSGHWSEITMPHVLQNTCTMVFNNILFVIGGTTKTKQGSEKQFSNSIHELDLDSEQWSKSLCMKTERSSASAILIDQTYLVVFGGDGVDDKPVLDTEIFRIDENKPYLSSLQIRTNDSFQYCDQNPIVLPEKLFSYMKIEFDGKK